jgi:tRNA G37 N-methylase TrmD
MFICAATGVLTKANEPAHRLVTHVRNKNYTRRNHKTNNDEVIGSGQEIVREILVCKEYYENVMAKGFTPEVVRS